MTFWEIALCAILASLLAAALGGLRTSGVFRRRAAHEPPLDKGFIPWLGHGISFKKRPMLFLEEMRKKHGDIFTVLVGGMYINVVTDPFAFEQILKEPKEVLDFNGFAVQVVSNAFGFQPTESHHKIVLDSSKKYLRGKTVADLNQTMLQKLGMVLLRSQGAAGRSWRQEGLLQFTCRTVFHSSFLALFGTQPDKDLGDDRTVGDLLKHCEELFEAFLKFDKVFPQMAFNLMSRGDKQKAQQLKEYFWDQLWSNKISCNDNTSKWVVDQMQQMAEIGMTEKMQTQVLLLLLWASQANTGPAVFWILAYLLKHPEAMRAVKEEVEKALREADQEVKSEDPFLDVSLDMLKTPLLDSAVQETLRLIASSFVFRSVMQDVNLKMGNGTEYTVRKGDQLLIFPLMGLHTDPEIYPDPLAFKYDRFLNPDGIKKEFHKDGKKLKFHTLSFGGGETMCPGRFFAVSEMKLLVIVMLSYFEMELVNAGDEMPPIDESRCGLGTSHPAHDIQFRYRPRF